jgi:ribosomal protein S18 acetylase RimI-like enzyme
VAAGLAMIRAATETDLPALVRLNAMVQDLHARSLPAHFKLPGEAGPADWFRKILAESATAIWVAEEDQSVVGYLFAQEVQKEENWLRPSQRVFLLEHLAVASEFRRKGIGHALVSRYFAEAKERGIARTEVVHWCCNEAAGCFFRKHGFEPLYVRLGREIP